MDFNPNKTPIEIINGSNFVDKSSALYFFLIFFLLYIKMGESNDLTHYQKNKDLILNKAKEYCKNNKERLRRQARDYRNLSE